MRSCDPQVVRHLREAFKANGAKFSDYAPWDANFFGIRIGQTGTFDDIIGCARSEDVHLWWGTTDPGIPYLRDPMNPKGTAAIVPGQYRRVWKYGTYKSRPALVQVGAFEVYRDNNRDDTLDLEPGSRFMAPGAGIHLHYMGDGKPSRTVGKWSAGCHGVASAADHAEAMAVADAQAWRRPHWLFSYTLFHHTTFPDLDALVALLPAR